MKRQRISWHSENKSTVTCEICGLEVECRGEVERTLQNHANRSEFHCNFCLLELEKHEDSGDKEEGGSAEESMGEMEYEYGL